MTDHTTDTRADVLSDAPLVPACPTPGWPGGYAATGASPFDGLLGVRVPTKLPPGVARHCVVDGKRIDRLSQLRPLLDMEDPTDRDRARAVRDALRSQRQRLVCVPLCCSLWLLDLTPSPPAPRT